MATQEFQRLLQQAVNDVINNGYDSPEQIDGWLIKLRNAAEREVGGFDMPDAETQAALDLIYNRLINRGGVSKYIPDMQRYTLDMVRPELRAELDRRILASADLIKLHKAEAVNKTLQRFSGWSTSIPAGGVSEEGRREVKAHVGKPLQQYRYECRRVAQDQGHKLIANVADIVAVDSGAIAGIWHSHWRRPGYAARKDHKDRDLKVYAIRGSWADKEGLINKGDGYTDEITMPAVDINCTCFYEYITSPRRLPESMLTNKGKEWVKGGK